MSQPMCTRDKWIIAIVIVGLLVLAAYAVWQNERSVKVDKPSVLSTRAEMSLPATMREMEHWAREADQRGLTTDGGREAAILAHLCKMEVVIMNLHMTLFPTPVDTTRVSTP